MRPRASLLIALLAVAGASPVPSASAQVRDPSPVLLRRAARENWLLRLSLRDRQVAGRIRTVNDSVVFLARGEAALDSVRLIERGRRRGDGGRIGALVGAAAVAWLGIEAAGYCEGSCPHATVRGAVGGAVVGALVGFGLGELVAPGRIEWRRIWP
ncbi:MAG TPA: hypothetical protein VFQ38_21185 [Longimicrobiales bacterium]|nr:hypothetical protein [Longimicrobiales bacterium]